MKVMAIVLLAGGAVAPGQATNAEIQRKLAELHARSRAGAATSQPVAAAPAPATSRPAANPRDLHAQAVALMSAGRFDKAAPLIEQAYRATPATDVSRELVLNRAILDMTQKVNIQRAVKDLSTYVAQNPNDELAVDMLGSAVSKATAYARRFPETALAKDADRTLAGAVAQLEAARIGQRKWGARWLTQFEFEDVQVRRHRVEMELESAERNWRGAQQRLDDAKREAADANRINTALGQRRPAWAKRYDGYDDTIARNAREQQQRQNDTAQQVTEAEQRLKDATARLEAARQAMPKPEWPATFAPLAVDAAAVAPAPPQPAAATPAPTPAQSILAQPQPAPPPAPVIPTPVPNPVQGP
jgi:hypothetical protein